MFFTDLYGLIVYYLLIIVYKFDLIFFILFVSMKDKINFSKQYFTQLR